MQHKHRIICIVALDKIPKDLNAIVIRLSEVAKILAHKMNKVRKVWDPRNLMIHQ